MRNTTNIRCFECDALATQTHHVVPICKGGTKTVPLCDACHAKAHHRTITTAAMTKYGLDKRKAAGFKTGGRCPYGYRADAAGKLHPVESEQAVLREIVEKCANKGYGRMARELNKRKVPTRTGADWSSRVIREIYLRLTA